MNNCRNELFRIYIKKMMRCPVICRKKVYADFEGGGALHPNTILFFTALGNCAPLQLFHHTHYSTLYLKSSLRSFPSKSYLWKLFFFLSLSCWVKVSLTCLMRETNKQRKKNGKSRDAGTLEENSIFRWKTKNRNFIVRHQVKSKSIYCIPLFVM